MPSAVERAEYHLAEAEPVVEIQRWDGTTEIHRTRGASFSFVSGDLDPDQLPRLAKIQQIADEIRGAIASGRLRPGERIPTEEQLVVQYGVSRATVRRVLAELCAVGLISTDRPDGTTDGPEGTFVVDRED
jgi:hypothetical protein